MFPQNTLTIVWPPRQSIVGPFNRSICWILVRQKGQSPPRGCCSWDPTSSHRRTAQSTLLSPCPIRLLYSTLLCSSHAIAFMQLFLLTFVPFSLWKSLSFWRIFLLLYSILLYSTQTILLRLLYNPTGRARRSRPGGFAGQSARRFYGPIPPWPVGVSLTGAQGKLEVVSHRPCVGGQV